MPIPSSNLVKSTYSPRTELMLPKIYSCIGICQVTGGPRKGRRIICITKEARTKKKKKKHQTLGNYCVLAFLTSIFFLSEPQNRPSICLCLKYWINFFLSFFFFFVHLHHQMVSPLFERTFPIFSGISQTQPRTLTHKLSVQISRSQSV